MRHCAEVHRPNNSLLVTRFFLPSTLRIYTNPWPMPQRLMKPFAGIRRISFRLSHTRENANLSLTPDDVGEVAASARVLLVQLEVPTATVHAALVAARSSGAMTILNPAPAAQLDAATLALCDVVIPNEHEVDLLGGSARLLEIGARTVVVTLGARGSLLITRDSNEVAIPAFAIRAVDTTAAGDAFCGAFAAACSRGDEIIDALRFASAGGALAATRSGAVPSLPTRAEIEGLVTGEV